MAIHFWWIHTIRVRRGHFYRYQVTGFNDATGEAFYWSIPKLCPSSQSRGGGRYVFRLLEVD